MLHDVRLESYKRFELLIHIFSGGWYRTLPIIADRDTQDVGLPLMYQDVKDPR